MPSTKLTTVIGWANEYPSPKPTLTVSKNLGSKNILKVLYAGNVGPAQGLDTVLKQRKPFNHAVKLKRRLSLSLDQDFR